MSVNALSLQHTLKSSIPCNGIGLHTGAKVSMVLRPAAVNTGIVFRRTDLPAARAEVLARWDKVVDTRLCTVVANDRGSQVGTVEHVMAALRGCGVDNAIIEVNAPELPVMDGSSDPFVFLIACAGIVAQSAPRRYLRVLKEVRVADGQKLAQLSPATQSSFRVEIEFDTAAIRRQEGSLQLPVDAQNSDVFRDEVSRARTFGFLHEVEAMQKAGLARGGSMENAVVISGDRVMNEGGLRMADEFVRHKILDAVGDLYMAGAPILGHFHGVRPGHAMNNQVLRALFADSSAWCWEMPAAAAEPVPLPVRRRVPEKVVAFA
jgi:UDP-3-O-[3-hydroxymyristoyl] N-acetylglucosamine deacetylase